MIKWVSEIVTIAYEDGQKTAVLFQNNENLELFMLKKANRQNVSETLEVENPI